MALEVLQMLREQPGIQPNVVCFGAGITACAKGRHWQGAFALLDELRERALDPDLIAFNAAITACEKAQRWEFALELLMMMTSSHVVTPDIVSFNAAASACEKRSQWCWALWVASQTRCLPKLQGSVLLTISNACISACAKARRLRKALALGCEPWKVTYNGLVAACRSSGGEYWDMIFALMRQMQRRRVAPGADVFGAAADAALEAGQPLFARPVMKHLEQCCLSELTDASLFARSWSDKEPTRAVGQLPAGEPHVHAWSALLRTAIDDTALALSADDKEAIQVHRNGSPDADSLLQLLMGCKVKQALSKRMHCPRAPSRHRRVWR
ncbi:unnamed protein product [Symbiodinium necroappetens]|uniref:Pentatricopeptide repeat-containing protein, chloroplastic n=1 Tax=Symbiodinium necroappetens TaxID=1628268 RepID=A0A813CGU3_9DINO|nr:unnamed protein product [Symbiodinium necroappetens]